MRTEKRQSIPPWAFNNAQRFIRNLKSEKLVGLLAIPFRPGKQIDKARYKADIDLEIDIMQQNGQLRFENDSQFVGLFKHCVEEPKGQLNETVSLNRLTYKITKAKMIYNVTPILSLTFHCLARIYQRDIQNAETLSQFLLSPSFIEAADSLIIDFNDKFDNDPGFSQGFAFEFGDGFVVGSSRLFNNLDTVGVKITLDAQTFYRANEKPDWPRTKSGTNFIMTSYVDRRARDIKAFRDNEKIQTLMNISKIDQLNPLHRNFKK